MKFDTKDSPQETIETPSKMTPEPLASTLSNNISKGLPLPQNALLDSFLKDSLEAQEMPRYFGEIECRYCRKLGHKFRDCPDKSIKCNLCQQEHDPLKCALQEVCFLCWKRGHMRMDCPFGRPPRKECLKCNTKDHHTTMDCTSVWRDYVTQKEPFESFDVYCYYCGDSGHFGDFCNQRKQNIYQPSAFDYDRNDIVYWKSKIERPKSFVTPRSQKKEPAKSNKHKQNYDSPPNKKGKPNPRYSGGY